MYIIIIMLLYIFSLGCVSAPESNRNKSLYNSVYYAQQAGSIIGKPGKHIVQDRETFAQIARKYNIGFNELTDLYPAIDPWIPPEGKELLIPTQWILPGIEKRGIVINIAEMRLYDFGDSGATIYTYPVGIGDNTWETPQGSFKIVTKTEDPTWFVPKSLQKKYGVKKIAPGPRNPLGKHWLGLDKDGYGIHGTNFPLSIGRRVTHGCIRLYPDDIKELYERTEEGTNVTILYEPIKIGMLNGRIYVEAHHDIYNNIDDYFLHGLDLLTRSNLTWNVNMKKFRLTLERKCGFPVDVTAEEFPAS
ncbi:MAG: L,D-transpeptidase family protein [Chitinivibrionales bacterium]|nr:L,D-transpeptidase family protein [Chitinivibrionales bacterium]